MDTIVRFTVYDEPQPWQRPTRVFKNGRAWTISGNKNQRAQDSIRNFAGPYVGKYGMLEGAIDLTVWFWVAQPKNIPKKRRHTVLPTKRPDCDNLAKNVLDALNGLMWRDDAQVVSLTLHKRYAVDTPPRYEVTVRAMAAATDGGAVELRPPDAPA